MKHQSVTVIDVHVLARRHRVRLGRHCEWGGTEPSEKGGLSWGNWQTGNCSHSLKDCKTVWQSSTGTDETCWDVVCRDGTLLGRNKEPQGWE